MQVRPENRARDAVRRVNQVMVIRPVDPNDDEAEDVRDEDRNDRLQRVPVRTLWNAQLEHHDRDQNRDHAVAERLEARLVQWTGRPAVIANVRSCAWIIRMFFGPIRSSCFWAPLRASRRSSANS